MKAVNHFKLIGLIFIYFLLNLLILPYMFKEKYHFVNSFLPYFLDPDSYYYLGLTNVYFAYFLAILLPIATITIFYLICSKVIKVKSSFLATFALISFPSFFSQMYIPNFDMQKFTLFMFLIIIFGILLFRKNLSISIILIFSSLFIVEVFWSGSIIITTCLVFGLIFGLIKGIKKWLLLILLGTIGFITYWTRFEKLILLKKLLVSEYSTPNYFLYYIVFVFMVYWYIFFYKNRDNECGILLGCSLFMFSLSMFLGRFKLFAIILILLVIVKMRLLDKKLWRVVTVCIILFNILVMFVSYTNTIPRFDRDEELFLSSCFNESYTILTYWDNGHVVEYFSGNKAIFKANPVPPYYQQFNKGLSTNNLTILDGLTTKPYYLYIKRIDLNKLYWEGLNTDLLNKTFKTGYFEGFNTICYANDKLVLLREDSIKTNFSDYMLPKDFNKDTYKVKE